MRVLGFLRHLGPGGLSPFSYYRVGLPLRALDKFSEHEAEAYNQLGLYNKFLKTLQSGGSLADAVSGYDIYVLSRLYEEEGAAEYVKQVHAQGGKVVFDTDDDMSEEYRELGGAGERFVAMLEAADLVTVSTPHLAERVAPHTKREPAVLPNHIDTGWFGQCSLSKEREHQGVNIGVVGVGTHYMDWRFLWEPFARIAEEYDRVNILTAGYQPDYLEEYTFSHPVPYEEYPGLMREFDIVCCALDPEDKFNKSKSSIKALEAMASARQLPGGRIGGAVPVCTDMPVYQRTVEHKVNGLLVDNDNWYKALKLMIDDELLRIRMACRGHRWVRENRDIRNGYALWERAYLDLLEG